MNYRAIFIGLTCILTVVVALLVMLGWFLRVPSVLSVLPGAATMKFTTAASFFMSALILWFATRALRGFSDWAMIVIPTASLAVWIVMTTTLVSMVLGFSTGIENIFPEIRQNEMTVTVPGRPSFGTIFSFLLITIMGVSVLAEGGWRRILFHWGGCSLVCIGSAALLGYTFGVPWLYFSVHGISNAMAIHTALLFMLFGFSFLSLKTYIRATL